VRRHAQESPAGPNPSGGMAAQRADVYDSAHELYVADQNNNRIQVFSLSGASGVKRAKGRH
jgi:NHL repeat-containing protein